MWGAPFPRTLTQLRADDLVSSRSSLIEYALRSSGPKTEAGNDDRGEMQSVRRTAETVVVALEDTSEITQAFEAAIFADYDA